MHIEIVSSSRKVLDCESSGISLPTTSGYVEILENHAPFVSEIATGVLKLASGPHADTAYFISGGYLEIKDNKLTILADVIEEKSEIDRKRAEQANIRAQERLDSFKEDVDIVRARASIDRAAGRLSTLSR